MPSMAFYSTQEIRTDNPIAFDLIWFGDCWGERAQTTIASFVSIGRSTRAPCFFWVLFAGLQPLRGAL
jgi:hypothetical protein